MRLLVVRHGESEGNARRIIQSRAEFDLTETGRGQARLTADVLAGLGLTKLFTSHQRRAVQTTDEIAAASGVEAIVTEDLAEYDVGEIAGMELKTVRENYPGWPGLDAEVESPEIPGEEGVDSFFGRVKRFLSTVAESEPDAVVAAVTHGMVVRAICHAVLKMPYGLESHWGGPFVPQNCAVTEIRTGRDGTPVLMRSNDTCHLED